MIVTVDNSFISIQDPDPELVKGLRKRLSYKDKAAMFQVKRMSNSPFLKKSQKYEDLKKKINGCVLECLPDGSVRFPSGLLHILAEFNINNFIDNRKHTGQKLSFPWKEKPFDCRDYQDEGVSVIEANYRSLICMATGLGKTLLAIHAIRRIGRKTLIIVPSESIAKQFYKALCSAYGENRIGFFGSGKKKINDITVGIAASVCNSIDQFVSADLGLIIWDETHHISADTFFSIGKALSGVGIVTGLTATDYRSDGKDILITSCIGPTLLDRDIVWGVKNGWLAQPHFLIREIDTSHIKDCGNDKLKNYKMHVLKNEILKKRIRDDILNMLIAGKSVLCLVSETEHGEELAKELNVPFARGEDKESQSYVEALNDGKIRCLVGTTGKVGEGTDTKNVDVLIMANFIASQGPVTQALGRGLRKTETKNNCIILDYIPTGSEMLTRHAWMRISYYKEITDKVKVIQLDKSNIPEWVK